MVKKRVKLCSPLKSSRDIMRNEPPVPFGSRAKAMTDVRVLSRPPSFLTMTVGDTDHKTWIDHRAPFGGTPVEAKIVCCVSAILKNAKWDRLETNRR